ncbi:hypothetical protein [Rossellomorea arthrocnemi]|uniref:hypothetical protein n=1 Tax=Rossellomorea arthrocnemi TaxID=2769542 RepID=UPI001918A428|nr:hypothetical protein [Rossellomorea arthrocnemi]
MGQAADDDVYSQNIQISELNALNANMGVVAWKKIFGFYLRDVAIYHSIFVLDEEVVSHGHQFVEFRN